MKLTKEILKKIEQFAKEKHKNSDEWHDWSHIARTVKLAEYLAKKEKANQDVVLISALLHDIGQSIRFEKHNETGAKMAGKFLQKLGLDRKFIKQIEHCIICHSTSRVHEAKTIEAKVIYDADMLQIIGPFGVMRFIISDMINEKKPFQGTYKLAKEVEAQTYNKTLQTQTAKDMAQDGYKFMQKFYQLYDKWDKLKGLKCETK